MKATLKFQNEKNETVLTFEGVAVHELSEPHPAYPVGSLCIEDDLTIELPPSPTGKWRIVSVEAEFEDGRRARFSDDSVNWYGEYEAEEDSGSIEFAGGGEVVTGRQDL